MVVNRKKCKFFNARKQNTTFLCSVCFKLVANVPIRGHGLCVRKFRLLVKLNRRVRACHAKRTVTRVWADYHTRRCGSLRERSITTWRTLACYHRKLRTQSQLTPCGCVVLHMVYKRGGGGAEGSLCHGGCGAADPSQFSGFGSMRRLFRCSFAPAEKLGGSDTWSTHCPSGCVSVKKLGSGGPQCSCCGKSAKWAHGYPLS